MSVHCGVKMSFLSVSNVNSFIQFYFDIYTVSLIFYLLKPSINLIKLKKYTFTFRLF